MVDLNHLVGEKCKKDLDQEFGEENCIFIQCDVTQREKLRGKVTLYTRYSCYYRLFIKEIKCDSIRLVCKVITSAVHCSITLYQFNNVFPFSY